MFQMLMRLRLAFYHMYVIIANIKTYWPAGGGRGQNPCRTGLAQGLDLCLKYGPRALCSQFYMSQGRLYVPREVDLADKTRVAALPSSCPPGQPPLGHIGSLGTYRILNRVPAGRIFSTGRALGRDLCDKDFVLVRLQQANMSYMPLSRFTGSAECCNTGSVFCIMKCFE